MEVPRIIYRDSRSPGGLLSQHATILWFIAEVENKVK